MTLAPPDHTSEANASSGLPARKVCVVRPNVSRPVDGEIIPLEALSLAGWARHQSQRAVRLLDAADQHLSLEATCERLVHAAPDVIVISNHGQDPADLQPILEAIASRLPECVRVLAEQGARPHPEGADFPPVQFLLNGDVGPGLQRVLHQLELGTRDFAGIPGLSWRTWQGEWKSTPPWHTSSSLPDSPAPAWDLIHREGQSLHGALRTARVCPPDCPTCHGAYGRTIRRRSTTEALNEARLLVQTYGVRQLSIVDEVFDFEPSRAKDLLRGLIALQADLDLRLPEGLRGDRIDAEMAQLLRQAGLRSCHIQIGSTTPRIQRQLGSNLDLPALRKGIEALAAQGIRVHGHFGLGFEFEDPRQRERTIAFAKSSGLHSASFKNLGSGNQGPVGRRLVAVRFYCNRERLSAWRLWAKDRYTTRIEPKLQTWAQKAKDRIKRLRRQTAS
ncbi:MAG: anaerobic magnesium-protoporphyrin IX monomethyl ester cyclase [Glaciecola sp.]|jgi:anaerobic magnesium-protoporphyrin IX monomethyl ester cyclase